MDEIPSSEFDGREFDAREFVQRYRKRVPLKELQKSLRAHHAATRQELVELINEKYADFVSLSSRMQGVERALKPLRAPLEESTELTKSLQSKLGGLLGQAEESHKALAGIRSREEALTTYIQNAKLLDKAKAASGQRHECIARDLRRIRLNLGGKPRSRVSELAAKASAEDEPISPECAALLAEAAEFESSFSERLRERLQSLLTACKRTLSSPGSAQPGGTGPPRAELLEIAHLCRALTTLGRADIVEAVFTSVFVIGVIQTSALACASAAEDVQRRGEGGTPVAGNASFAIGFGSPDLGPFFESLKAALFVEGAPLLWFAQCLRGSSEDTQGTLLAVPNLQLVASACAVPVLLHVQQEWPNVFMPAPPDVFATNYAHASSFLQAAQAHMLPAEHQAFLQSKALLDFQKKWKTQVYCSLRAKEAFQAFEVAGAKAVVAETKEHAVGSQSFWLQASAELVRLLELVWSDRWYLDVVYSKMLQLSLELMARYAKSLHSLTSGSDTGGAWDSAAASPSWPSNSLPVQLSRAAADVCEVLAMISCRSNKERGVGSVAETILGKAPEGAGGRPVEIARLLLQEADVGLRPVLDVLEVGMLKQVAAAVTPQFAGVKAIPSLFRVQDRPVPSRASAYVEPALRPIQAFRDVAQLNAPADVVAGWVQHAVDTAAIEFSAQATQLIESTQQQQASLQRIADRTTGGAAAAVSNFDKMHIQLCLDVESFAEAASKLGVDAKNAPGLEKLTEAVAKISGTLEAHRINSQ